MNDERCPWCEADVQVASADEREQTCAECLTVWSYEEASFELALAA